MSIHTKIVCIVMLFLLIGGINVYAIKDEFEIIEVSIEDANQIWENIDVQQLSESLTLNDFSDPIVSFDVSESKNVVIGLKNDKIIILDDNKNILHCYQFDIYGTFYVQWEGDNILLFIVRGSIVAEMSVDGELISMMKTDDSSIKNTKLWNQIITSKETSIKNCSYTVQNHMGFLNLFLSSYSQLIKTDEKGNVTILYDVSTAHTTQTITMFIFIILFIAIVVSTLLKSIIRPKTRTEQSI